MPSGYLAVGWNTVTIISCCAVLCRSRKKEHKLDAPCQGVRHAPPASTENWMLGNSHMHHPKHLGHMCFGVATIRGMSLCITPCCTIKPQLCTSLNLCAGRTMEHHSLLRLADTFAMCMLLLQGPCCQDFWGKWRAKMIFIQYKRSCIVMYIKNKCIPTLSR